MMHGYRPIKRLMDLIKDVTWSLFIQKMHLVPLAKQWPNPSKSDASICVVPGVDDPGDCNGEEHDLEFFAKEDVHSGDESEHLLGMDRFFSLRVNRQTDGLASTKPRLESFGNLVHISTGSFVVIALTLGQDSISPLFFWGSIDVLLDLLPMENDGPHRRSTSILGNARYQWIRY